MTADGVFRLARLGSRCPRTVEFLCAHRRWVNPLAGSGLAVAVVATMVGAGVSTGPLPATQHTMRSGSAWLTSTRTGQTVLVDGLTAEVVTALDVSEPGHHLTIAQHGPDAYVTDTTTGTIRHIHSTTLTTTTQKLALHDRGTSLGTWVAAASLYAVDLDHGTVTPTDPETLESRPPLAQLHSPVDPRSVAVDSTGRLFAVDATGTLLRTTGKHTTTRSGAFSGAVLVTIAAGIPTVVDQQQSTITVLDPRTGGSRTTSSLQLPALDQIAQVVGSPATAMIAVTTAHGTLLLCEPTTGRCPHRTRLGTPTATARLGSPVISGDRIYVPNLDTGQVRIVDATALGTIANPVVLPAGAGFELVVHDSIVFFNNPDGQEAGVITPDGTVRRVTKIRLPDQRASTTGSLGPSGTTPHPAVSTRQSGRLTGPGAGGLPSQGNGSTGTGPSGGTSTSTSTSPVTGSATVAGWGGQTLITDVPAGLTGVTAIAAGQRHSLALRQDGTVTAWGDTSAGQTVVPVELADVTAIAAGQRHSLALRQDGTVTAWGNNQYGQTTVPAGLTDITDIAAGGNHSLALRRDGTVTAWGNNYNGQARVPAGLTDITDITAGWVHSLALRRDGTVVAWGDNNLGQTTVPAGLADVTAIAAGGVHSLVLRKSSS